MDSKPSINQTTFDAMFNEEVTHLVSLLQNGELILYPTDTVWGIGCDALNEDAIKKVLNLKQRTSDKGLIILVDGDEMLKEYVSYVSNKIGLILEFHKRPLTLIYETPKNIPSILMSQDGSIAIRMVQDAFCKSIIRKLGHPIVSTSANIAEAPSPHSFSEIQEEIKQGVAYVSKYRRQDKLASSPSIVAKLSKKGELLILRD